MLQMAMGIMNGCTRRGPEAITVSVPFWSVSIPPIPDPMVTATRSRLLSSTTRPAFRMASSAATSASAMLRSIRRASFGGRSERSSAPGTSPAKRTG